MSNYTEFGLQVRIALLKRKMSIAKLAEEIGTSRQYLFDILNGSRPGKRHKPEIARILGLEESKGA